MPRFVPLTCALLLTAAPLLARPTYTGYSGAPGRGTCASSCHGGSNGTVTVDGFPALYTPGTPYTVTVSRASGSTISNFNGSCRLGSGTSNAGVLSTGSGTAVYSTNGETNGVRMSSNNHASATFVWTAPAAGSGEATLYLGAFQGTSMNSGQTTAIELVTQEDTAGAPLELAVAGWEVSGDDDGDGVAEPGESFFLSVELLNEGAGATATLQGVLAGDGEWIDVLDAMDAWPALEPGETAAGDGGFQLQVDAGAPGLFEAGLTLLVGAGEEMLELPLTLPVGERVELWSDACEVPGGWSHDAPEGWMDGWGLAAEPVHGGAAAWLSSAGVGFYPDNCDSRLATELLDLTDGARLDFWHSMDSEISSSFPDSAFDGGVLELQLEGSEDWLPLEAAYDHWFRGRTGAGDPATHPFVAERPCFAGEFGWRLEEVDLSAWAGQRARVAFRFGSDNGTSGLGWALDDLTLTGAAADVAVPLVPVRPRALALEPAFPNPFNPSTTLAFTLPRSAEARLAVYDLGGRLRAVLQDGPLPAGRHERSLDGAAFASGLYVVRLDAGGETASQRVLLVK